MKHQEWDRVRCSTSDEANRNIDAIILSNLKKYEGKSHSEISKRIKELEKEWSIERWLEMNASILAFIGVILGFVLNIYWLILPGFVLLFLALHAIQGWCPPIPIMRRLNVRTRKEIDWEKFALKMHRGDFSTLSPKSSFDEIFEKVKTN